MYINHPEEYFIWDPVIKEKTAIALSNLQKVIVSNVLQWHEQKTLTKHVCSFSSFSEEKNNNDSNVLDEIFTS